MQTFFSTFVRTGALKAISLAAVLCMVFYVLIQTGCNPPGNTASNGDDPNATNRKSGLTEVSHNRVGKLAIGTFNIKMFGKTKMSKDGVVGVLVDIVRKFDIIAIQELRDKDQNVIPEFLKRINSNGSSYAAAVGPRQSYSSEGKSTRYSEQTVFIYDMNTVELVGPTYAAIDNSDLMYRPPFVGHFRARGVPRDQAFSFVLMNVHVRPTRPEVEFRVLANVMAGIYRNHSDDDFILLGDLNDRPSDYQGYNWLSNQVTAIPDAVKTNTVQTKSYDNLVFNAIKTSEFTGEAGVINLMQEYNLALEDAQLVSDHMPVWALFSAYEAPSAAITQGGDSVVR